MKIAGCLLMIGVMLLMPGQTTQAARTALSVWGMDVVPSLFPYMVFCRMLAARLSRSGVPAAPTTAILGMMGGSPSGASVLSAYAQEGTMTRRQVLSLSALAGTISPMFLLNTVDTWIKDASFCRLLLASHLFGALFSLVIVCLITRSARYDRPAAPAWNAQNRPPVDPITDSINSTLGVGGCIVYFSVLSAAICALLPHALREISPVLHATLEIAGGLHALAASSMPMPALGVLMAALSGFSGLSIISQNLLFLRPFGVRLAHLLAFALLRMVGAGAFMAACLALL